MKKLGLIFILFSFCLMTSGSACSRKTGCPANESLKPKTNKKGEIVGSKKKKSGLFPKDIQKRLR